MTTRPNRIEAEAACFEYRLLIYVLGEYREWGVYPQICRSTDGEWCYAIHVARKPV